MDELTPRSPIRRFDVFADYERLRQEARGMPEAQAKGRAIWAAKVVAGRRGGAGSSPSSGAERPEKRGTAGEEDQEARSVGGVPQTDRTFDKEIVERMGRAFYDRVFHPAIERAFREGKRYEEIRDAIRQGWK
jgi:hypothetical protein